MTPDGAAALEGWRRQRPAPDTDFQVCVVGAGPRGVSVLERVCSNAAASPTGPRIVVHVVDPHPPGAGRVWRAGQSEHLLMNTVSSQVTLFTDASVRIDGPVSAGPSLHEWARFVSVVGLPGTLPDEVLAEAARLGPDTYPTRALYGRYLTWAFRRIVGTAPSRVDIRVHQTTALSLDDAGHGSDGPQTVTLADGTVLDGLDVVVLAQGHVPVEPTAAERDLARFASANGLAYWPPGNPADVDLSGVLPDDAVVLRGLGLSFFDHVALLTLGRGGRFEPADGSLVYRASGNEPRIYAGSRRGVPFHARGENQKGAFGRHDPVVMTSSVVADLRERSRSKGGVDFRADVWPWVSREVEGVYYEALIARDDCVCSAARFRTGMAQVPVGQRLPNSFLDDFGVAAGDRWDWDQLANPVPADALDGPDEFRVWLLDYLAEDLRRSRAGNVSGPVKAALDVLRDLRNEVRLVVDHAGLTGASQRDDLEGWYSPLNAFLSIGPPASRIEELVALVEAGVVTLLGPAVSVVADTSTGMFVASSARIPGSQVHVSALVEARLPDPDLSRADDPVLKHLLATGQCRRFTVTGPSGDDYLTAGLEVTERPYRLVDASGRAHPRRFALGIPTEAVHWVTAAGIRPGVDSVLLGDTDSIARSVLSTVPAERADTAAAAA